MTMWQSIKKYWRYFIFCWTLHSQRMMEYRLNFAFWAAISVMWTVFNFFMFGTIAKLNNGVAGWTLSEMMVLQAVFTIMDAFVWSWFYPTMSRFTDAVFDGRFIDTLLKPLDPFTVVFLKKQ